MRPDSGLRRNDGWGVSEWRLGGVGMMVGGRKDSYGVGMVVWWGAELVDSVGGWHRMAAGIRRRRIDLI